MVEIRDDSAGSAVRAHLVELIERLTVYDSRIRRHERGGVHKMRVTLRRLRSLLATFGPVFDAEVVAPLRDELKWTAGELGGARDSERYSQVLRDLNSLVSEPPWTPDAERSSDDLLRRRVRREWKRLTRRVDIVHETPRGPERQAAFHEVRKAAKRLRYSAQTLVPAYGDDARRLTRGAKRIQTDLGELQDSAVSQEMLREMTTADGIQTHEAFILGGLHTKERLRSAQAEDHFARSWGRISRKRNRRWLT